MASFIERNPEPLPLTQRIREILQEAGARVDPILYHVPSENFTVVEQTVIDGWKDRPREIEVEIRFRIELE